MCAELGGLQGSWRQKDPIPNPHRATLTVMRPPNMFFTLLPWLCWVGYLLYAAPHTQTVTLHHFAKTFFNWSWMLFLFSASPVPKVTVVWFFCTSLRLGPTGSNGTRGKVYQQWASFNKVYPNKFTHQSSARAFMKVIHDTFGIRLYPRKALEFTCVHFTYKGADFQIV